MPHALIVDDDHSTVLLVAQMLEQRGFSTRCVGSLAEARENLDPLPDCCVVEMRLPDGEGWELLDDGLATHSDFIMLTDDASVEAGMEAIRRGAREYLTKPFNRTSFERALSRFMPPQSRTSVANPMIGASPAMKQLGQAIERVAPTDVTVFIIGESGTGKELIASRIHALSGRARGTYLALNCGAVSPNLIESEMFGHEKGSFTGASRQHAGYFERAHGGTLFLDEITEMPMDLQVRLLRVLESRQVMRVGSSEPIPVNVRVIAATNQDPRDAVVQGRLREDLYYRLQVVPFEIPPLRARDGDIRLLALHFLEEMNRGAGAIKRFSDAALTALEAHHWPGNVRELYNVVQRAFILAEGRVITHTQIAHPRPHHAASAADGTLGMKLGDSIAQVEQRLILHTLQHCRTQEEAARLLGISCKTLYNKLRLYEAESRSEMTNALLGRNSNGNGSHHHHYAHQLTT